MARIKIISNPYLREIKYQRWNESSDSWTDIRDNNENSKLLSEELSRGFFPFAVKKIVDEIVAEYQDDSGRIEIVFEGTDDELEDLEMVCTQNYADLIAVSESNLHLENARDILPDIIEVFKRVKTLVSQTIRDTAEIERDLEKFSDASNDVIPICILGNYSSGKSTFINALIGREILPSGDEPVTAKIYKIVDSNSEDRAFIDFDYGGKDVRIRFEPDGYKFVFGSSDQPLVKTLIEALDQMKCESMTSRINRALEIINDFDGDTDEEKVSDLIEIVVPFTGGQWKGAAGNFVIFDTPGSNSASNDRHFEVLKKAMDGFSNGLPIYVSEFDSLDSTDNERLYKRVIQGMEELDSRFTMIIVNKADMARLPKLENARSKEKDILNQTIPKNLYSVGIFYVSSIIGLGSKCDGDFKDDHYAEIFEDQCNKYSDPSSRFYKTLYNYNIMPEQLRLKSLEASQSCKDLLYANSGLFAVEYEIQTFARKYSHYNKCRQSELFLGKVIRITSEEIDKARAAREESRKVRIDALERDKAELIQSITDCSAGLQNGYVQYYPVTMSDCIATINGQYSVEDLSKMEEELIAKHEEQRSFSKSEEEAKAAIDAVSDDLSQNIRRAFKTMKLEAFKSIGTSLASDTQRAREASALKRSLKREADRAAADELLQNVADSFNRSLNEIQTKLDEQSRIYWEDQTADLKEQLSILVTGSPVLTEAEKEKLSQVIITYSNIEFDNDSGSIFEREEFEYSWIAKIVKGLIDRLNTEKLRDTYNSKLAEHIESIADDIGASHERSLQRWVESLVSTIIDNIVDFNPSLHNQSNLIKEETAKIAELEMKQKRLQQYTEDIHRMMDWKEA